MNTRKLKVLIILLVAIVTAIAVSVVAFGSNITPSYGWYTTNPDAGTYTLNNSRDFAGFANLVNGTADVDGDKVPDYSALDFAGKTVVLSSNFDGNFYFDSVDPIGGQNDTVFNGTFDGNGKTLSLFSVDTAGITKNLGIFGHAGPDSVIKNFAAGSSASLTKTLSGTDLVAIENVGMIVGYSEGRIENCTNGGSVTIRHDMDQTYSITYPIKNIGGVAGKVLGDIDLCNNTGNVSVTENGVPYKLEGIEGEVDTTVIALNIGGVVGCAGVEDSRTNGSYDNTHGTITSCGNAGSVYINTPSENGYDRFGNQVYANSGNVGGVAGYSRGSASHSSNSGYVNAVNGMAVGGVVGGLRNSGEASNTANTSGAGGDDGRAEYPLTITECVNTGNIQGRSVVGGIIGRAGTYTTIQACINESGTFVVATRPNKPFPAGIVGVTYGTASYCANFGTIASGEFNGTRLVSTKAGYYAAGIAGATHFWTDGSGGRISPMPEVYGCYNAGLVLASGNFRQRHIVGNNDGYSHDNIGVTGFVAGSGDELVYGNKPEDLDASGTAARNYLVTEEAFKTNLVIEEASPETPLSLLNTAGDKEGWVYYWARPDGNVNQGYPLLNTQSIGNTDISSAVVSLEANAQYTGIAAVPKATVTYGGVTLEQGIDFKVIPQEDATDVTASGQTPYRAYIVAIGSTYTGTATQTLAYGIDAGDLSNCTVLIEPKQFNWEAQEPATADVHVYNMAGGELDSSEYTFKLDLNDRDLSELEGGGKGAVNAKKYNVIITAADDSEYFVGSTKGEFAISGVDILWNDDHADDSINARPIEISYAGTTHAWQSTSSKNKPTDEELVHIEYTGYKISPEVTKVTYLGRDLVIDRTTGDCFALYGETMDGTTFDNIGEVGGTASGYVTVTYVLGGNFRNMDNMRFLIVDTDAKNNIKDAQIKGDADVIFEEDSVYEPIEVWYGGSKLTQDVDYQITYSNNDRLGTASYVITGEGDNFEGILSGTFDIVEGKSYELEYSFNASSETASLIGGTYYGSNRSFEIEIPETVRKDGVTYTITQIAQNAFGNNNSSDITSTATKISKVTIPKTVKSIGANAFGSASSNVNLGVLTTVVFAEGSGLESIGDSAFRGTGISEIVIPANVKTIGNQAFRGCVGLTKVTFLSGAANMPNAAGFATGSTTTPFAGVTDVEAYGYDEATGIRTFVETYYESTDAGLRLGWTWNSMGEVPKYTVSFNSMGGSDIATQNVMAGGYLAKPINPTKSGYSFSGWYISTDGGTTFEENAFDFENFIVIENLTLYAQWTTGPATGLPGSGDYNGDGIVTGIDVIAVLRAARGGEELGASQLDALDVNFDGIITGIDVMIIRRLAIGQ